MEVQDLNRRVASMDTLLKQLIAWSISRYVASKVVDWQFTARGAQVNLKRLYPHVYTL